MTLTVYRHHKAYYGRGGAVGGGMGVGEEGDLSPSLQLLMYVHRS